MIPTATSSISRRRRTTRASTSTRKQANGEPTHERYINKFAIRTPNAEQCAEFYADVFELQPVNRKTDAPGYHLTDGRITLQIMPWSIPVFENMSIKRPGPDHIGFHVENLDAFKKHVAEVAGMNPYLAPVPLGGSPGIRRAQALLRASTPPASGRCPTPTATGSTSPTSRRMVQ